MPPRTVEGLAGRWFRRAFTVTGAHVALWTLVGLLPVALPVLGLWDLLTDPRFPRVRFWCFTCTYLLFEVAGLYGAFALWCVRPMGGPAADRARLYVLQHLWIGALFRGLEAFYGLRIQVDTPNGPPTRGGSPVVLMRHVSIADTLLPGRVLSIPFGLGLRYVLKRELLVMPCLDVVGQRLPNVWVRRGGRDTAGDLEGVRSLTRGLTPDEGVVLYPEGTRASPSRRVQALEALAKSDPDRHRRLLGLMHLLPPRPGGTLALLEAAPQAEVLIVGHVGFDGLRTFSQLWRGALIDRVIKVQIRRFETASLPTTPAERLGWLDARWLELDAWVEAQRPS
ncbi:MAG: 1-acyl-sn-glycerol-3-phosphate acyltransferase [Bradymonadia bacterium]